MRKEEDAYGHALWDFHTRFKYRKEETIERSDHYIDRSEEAPANYFAPYPKWPDIEKRATKYAKGRVLDVGCGAGRVAIYLQNERGLDALGTDNC
jgi:SAM-dependent methyltransferase